MASNMFNFNYDKAQLIAQLDLSDLSETDQNRVLDRVEQLLNQRVAVIVESKLSDEDLAQFNKIEDPSEAHALIAQNVPIDEISQHELDEIVAELKAGLDSI